MGSFSPGLFVVATPIGNLGDFSERARSVLAAAALVAAEDTRTSGKLLKIAGSSARSLSLTEHNVEQRIPEVLAAAHEGVVALVSDAGTPLVADPGARLVAAAHREDVPVYAVAGPSALAAAISVAGFEGPSVLFLGFLPRPKGERETLLRDSAPAARMLVFFESPNRLSASLAELAELFDDPAVVVCRELTKLHEEAIRGPASELAARFKNTRGECTVVVQTPQRDASAADDEAVREYMAEMQRAGARRSGAAAEAARRFGVAKDIAYAMWE